MTPKNPLFGLCYLVYENRHVLNPEKGIRLMENLGVGSVRHWMHVSDLLLDPDTVNPKAVREMQAIITRTKQAGIQMVGMNHMCFQPHGGAGRGKVHPDDPAYLDWLDGYGRSWATLVRAFPEVTTWEIDNELNNQDFMYLYQDPTLVLDLETMSRIAIDMLFYASEAIHRENPKAITVLGGLVDTQALKAGDPNFTLGKGTMKPFLERLYDHIESGRYGSQNPDDFFQKVAWHPYYYHCALDATFTAENDALYAIVKRREKKHKGVLLTEFGWTEDHVSAPEIAAFIEKLYAHITMHCPYVETLHYFRLLNNLAENNQKYGLFYDPKPAYNDGPMPGVASPAAPKLAAFAYQRAAGGLGSL